MIRVWRVSLVGLTVVALVGLQVGLCAGAMAQRTVTISLMHWITSQSDREMYKEVLAAFAKQNPDVRVKELGIAWAGEADWMAKLLSMASANVAPDVVFVPFGSFARVVESKLALPIDAYIAKDKALSVAKYSKAWLKLSSWKGKTYGLPYNFTADWWVTYNPRLFAKAGLLDPEQLWKSGSWNFDTIIEAASKLSRFDGNKCQQIGLTQMGDIFSVAPWIWGMGGDLVDEAGKTCLLDKKPQIDALRIVYDWIYKKKLLTFGAMPYGIGLDQSKQEKWAMAPWWQSLGSYLDSLKVSWPIKQVPFPVGPASEHTNLFGEDPIVVMRSTKNPEASYRLLKFWTTNGGATMVAKRTPRDPVYDEWARARLRVPFRTPRIDGFLRKIEEQLTKAWSGKADMEQAAAAAAKAATAELRR